MFLLFTTKMADIISNLPDSILCHILSFLPTKYAATTSILSKRWKPLWLLVLTLDFDNKNFINDNDSYWTFRDSVRKAMFLRVFPILSFRFKCCSSDDDPYDVDQFVCFAMQRGLENLNLNIDISLPRLVSCKTLKVLKLKRITGFDFSHHEVNFPVLKILHLKKVFFEPKYFVKTLSGCPMLEELKTKDLNVDSMDSFVPEKELEGLLPNLIKAKISGDYIIPITILSRKTLKVLKLKGITGSDFSNHQVNLPVLKILQLKKMFLEPKEYLVILSGCPMLEELKTKDLNVGSMDSFFPKKELEGLLPNLIKAKMCDDYTIPITFFRNVESLYMPLAGSIKSTTKLPMYHNLTHIKLKFVDIYLSDVYDWMLQMLDRSHKLQSLTFQICKYRVNFYEKRWKDPANVPDCLSSQLRTCCFTGYEDEELNLQFVKYMLQNSKVLKTMTIKFSCSNSVYMNAEQMLTELTSFTRGSETCKLLFD